MIIGEDKQNYSRNSRRSFVKNCFLSSSFFMLPDIKVLDYSLLHDKKWKMRKVGLIGGTSWHSTIEYYKDINQRVNHIKGNRVNPPLLVYNVKLKP